MVVHDAMWINGAGGVGAGADERAEDGRGGGKEKKRSKILINKAFLHI